MKKLVLLLVVLVALGAGAYYYLEATREPAIAQSTPSEAATAAAPQVRYPLPDVAGPPTGSQEAPGEPRAVAPPLPPLDASDRTVAAALASLLDPQALGQLRLDNIVRRLAVSIDNLPGEQVPAKFHAIKPVEGDFKADGTDDEAYLSADNYPRYDAYVRWLTAVDSEELVATYVRLYPLFQTAFAELGYPKDYFNDRLVAVIDNLLATPEVEGPIKLRRPSVMYKFADPELEALPAGQKVLLRMGPANAAKVRAKLRELRAALMEQVKRSDGAGR